ncbi:MAG: hypothetical protein ACRYFU_09775 [Janthinobacterium lividum]
MQGSNLSDVKVILDRELHDLAQPLASFQWRLEIALMVGGEEALEEAATGGLEDLRRITSFLARMRQLVADLQVEPAA